MKEITDLTGQESGMWFIQTETSSYTIDLDKHMAMRTPYDGLGIHPDHAKGWKVIVNKLPNDKEWFHFNTIEQCIVGYPMFLYESPAAGMWRSTLVRKITKVVKSD